MLKLALIGFVVSIPLLLNHHECLATTFANRPMGAIVKEAAVIVRGKARSSYSDWGRGANQRTIFTYTDLEVTEVLKGKVAEGRILIRQPGGIKDGMELSVPGTAAFNSGDDVVVTLASADPTDSAYDVLNFTAGKYNVVVEKDETFLVNSLSAGEVYDPNRGANQDPSYLSKISLSTFKQIIKGNAPQAAAQNQFQPQKAVPGQKPSPHAHPHQASASPQAQTPVQDSSITDNTAEAEPDNSNTRIWIPLSFFLLFTGIGLGLWIVLSKKRGGHED